ncbi:hypothetical protein HTS88_20975 [Pseudarthrobacter oxydans]|uniref:hypothetical protein n=1 Tax=Pseudarthrobacter oxydans TaxID=1671 RepID=UPI001571B849|nr:hypothetical protein [Pseudarthrobacter oxydans]NSX38855.1 hypothetical protein [Pseudarthrobacter oxydans]
MTDSTSPASTGAPTFWQWFLMRRKHLAYPFTTFLIFFALYSTANIAAAIAGVPLGFSFIIMGATLIMIIATLANYYRQYRSEERPTGATRTITSGPATGSTGGDSPVALGFLPFADGGDSHSHGHGHHGGHGDHAAGHGGGHSGDSGGGDGGGGGGD